MKKMTKGAIVTGLGVALLLGGGGTLAVWNDAVITKAGTIAAGTLDLEAGTGTWSSNLSGGDIENINDYKIIPGETLTYTQPITITLTGDQLIADLTLNTDDVTSSFLAKNVTVSAPVVTDANGGTVPTTGLTEKHMDTVTGPVTATTTFTFLESTTGQESTGTTYDFGAVKYVLTQQAPTPAA